MQMDAELDPRDVLAVVASVAAVEPPNPVHNVLKVCGITSVANHTTFVNVEGRNSIETYTRSMSGYSNLTEMARRIASRPRITAGRITLGNHANQETPSSCLFIKLRIVMRSMDCKLGQKMYAYY